MQIGLHIILLSMCIGLLANAFWSPPKVEFKKRDKLSEYNFFKGELKALQPAENVIPYDLNTPLFSNYAEKLRFIIIPPGKISVYNDTTVFQFPEGTILIKNFYYPFDFRHPDKGRYIIETRLLIKMEEEWEAYPYIWNKEQTEAYYDPAGETMKIQYVSESGKRREINYVVPNNNQCKGCHIRNEHIQPIGLTARNLNRSYPENENINQLQYWKKMKLVDGLPDSLPRLAIWDNELSGSLNERARAYLDINCGHCHSRYGPASTSGLFLTIFEQDRGHLGVLKSPVAAGRGAGKLSVDIDPGHPSNSILVFRMKTNDPAIAMPEIGREQIHEEGVKLIEKWIKEMKYED